MSDGWPSGGRGTGPLMPGTADRAAKRAEERANGREQRAKERLAASEQRSESRAAQRDLQSQERERARESRRIEEDQRLDAPPTNDVEALKISKRRRSGALARSGEESKTDRDTRSYKTIVDTARIRTLADRGASLSGLAGAFGITIEEVEAALLETTGEN